MIRRLTLQALAFFYGAVIRFRHSLFDVGETIVQEDNELDETKLEELEDEQLHRQT